MTAPELLEIELGSGTVRAALHLPTNGPAVGSAPAVLVCRGVHIPGEDAHSLFDELTSSLQAAGLAMALFEHRCADLILDDFDAHCAAHDVEDAAAVLAWIMERPGIDRERIGVIGYSLGAIAATAICQREPGIARLCLLSAATAAHVTSEFAKTNGDASALKPDCLPASYLPSLMETDSAREAASHPRPTLVLHGAADRHIAPEVSQEYVMAMHLAGRPFEHVLIAQANHTFSSLPARAACVQYVAEFFAAMITAAPTAAIAGKGAA